MAQEWGPDSMSVVALCALSRAAVIAVRLCDRELNEDLDDLRFNLRRFGSRWVIGRKHPTQHYFHRRLRSTGIYLQHISEIMPAKI